MLRAGLYSMFALLLVSGSAKAQQAPPHGMTNELTFTIHELPPEAGQTPTPDEPSRGAFSIVINPGATLAANSAALAAFNRAADQWEDSIDDAITVNINADLANLGGGVLGSTNIVLLSVADYTTLRTRWIADADADDDILASLPSAAARSFVVPAGFSAASNTASAKAALKAIGGYGDLDGQNGANDATITFNTQFAFDFDNSNGITPNTTDFETVAAHEIGHALGFFSTVDTIDVMLNNGQAGAVAPSTLDHLRFLDNSAADPASAANFSTFARELRTSVTSITDFITATGAEAAENRMATGRFTGDGHQASHWKADELSAGVNLGIMDPTLAVETVTLISDADLRALDLIGWDIIVAPDCNANNVPDADEIAAGTSDDCNANSTPDECDIVTPVLTSYSQTPNVAVPDNNPTGVSRVITVPDTGPITEVDVALHINHTWQGDLVVTLSHGGVTRTMMNRPGLVCVGNDGYAADNFGSAGNLLVLDDSALVPIDCYNGPAAGNGGTANYAVPAQPSQALSAFNGQDRSGPWTLTVSDHFPQDVGTLVTWRLDIETPPVDCNANGIPDECEADCNGNSLPDSCDMATGTSTDCQDNGFPDDCDIAAGTSADANGDGTPDECGVPAATLTGALSRKTHAVQGVRDIPMSITGHVQNLGTVTSEPRQGGITQLRLTFNMAPGGPGPSPVTIQQQACPACTPACNPPGTQGSYVPYAGAAVMGASIAGNDLVLNFAPGLESPRTYKLLINSSVTSIAGQSAEVRVAEGDLNSDARTNSGDRSSVVSVWTSTGFSTETDLNLDGKTNGGDRSVVVAAWTSATPCAP